MLTEHSKFCKGILLSMQYFCGLIMIFKKKGSIVEKMVIIVVSNIHGMIKLTNGLLLINSYNEGMNSILSVLNDSLRSDIFHDNKPIDNTNNTPISNDNVNNDV